MRQVLTFFLLVIILPFLSAQDDKWPDLDKSPMDLEYYPANVAWRNYLSNPDERNITPTIKLSYARPSKNGRVIFGDLVPYGAEWRLGANEATTLTAYRALGIGDQVLPRGSYTMSALINEGQWTINFSSESGIWGNANRDVSKTVVSYTGDVEDVPNQAEQLSMVFQEADDRLVNMVIEWDGRRVTVPMALNPILFTPIDASPMDMAHYPRSSAFNNYADGEDQKKSPKVQVVYSRPQKKGRTIFGDMLKEGDVWRLGANQATEITFYQDVTVGDTKLAAGRYALFAKLGATSWDIIFSKDFPIWGAYNRDEAKDVAAVTVPVSQDTEVLEALSIKFDEKSENLVHLMIGWDQTRVAIPITF